MTYTPRTARPDRAGRDEIPGRQARNARNDRWPDSNPADPDPRSDHRVELIELPDDVGEAAGTVTAESPGGGFLAAYARRGFADGRRRGFREAVALTSLAVEELIADGSLEEVPPSLLRQLAAALTAQLAVHAPAEGYVEGGLGI